mmetsp:Transcript_5657/g.11879  ORF Transcript_5657/g.11879 Transcript_5657/m.11879 type:complete len:497 (+) Transcript_5657:1388-2878(+)
MLFSRVRRPQIAHVQAGTRGGGRPRPFRKKTRGPGRASAGGTLPGSLPETDQGRPQAPAALSRRGKTLQHRRGHQIEPHHRRPQILPGHRKLGRQGKLRKSGGVAGAQPARLRIHALPSATDEHTPGPDGKTGQAQTAAQLALGHGLSRRDAGGTGGGTGQEPGTHGLYHHGNRTGAGARILGGVQHGEPDRRAAQRHRGAQRLQNIRQRKLGGDPQGSQGPGGTVPEPQAPARHRRRGVHSQGHQRVGGAHLHGRRTGLPTAVHRGRTRTTAGRQEERHCAAAGRGEPSQLDGPAHERHRRIRRHGGGGDHHDCHGTQASRAGALQGTIRGSFYIHLHALRDPSRHDSRNLRLHYPLSRSQPESQKYLPVGHGKAGHGHLCIQLSGQDGYHGSRSALPAETTLHYKGHGVSTFQGIAQWCQLCGRYHDLHGLQPGGFPHHEPVRNRPWPLPFFLLPLLQRPGKSLRSRRSRRPDRRNFRTPHARQLPGNETRRIR